MRNFVAVLNVVVKQKHQKLKDEELDFGEVLNKAIHKRK